MIAKKLIITKLTPPNINYYHIIMNFSGFDPSKTGKEIGTAGSNLACAFSKEREIEQCISDSGN